MITTIPEVRKRVHERHHGLCGICGKPISESSMHIDHIVPRSRGGQDEESNLQPAHKMCNIRKGGLLPRELAARQSTWSDGPFVRFVLRFPPDLHAELKALAAREGHSLHSLILLLLQRAIDERESQD